MKEKALCPELYPHPLSNHDLTRGGRASCSAVMEAPLGGPATPKLAVVRPLTASVKATTRGTSCSLVTRPLPPRYARNGERSAPRGLHTHQRTQAHSELWKGSARRWWKGVEAGWAVGDRMAIGVVVEGGVPASPPVVGLAHRDAHQGD